MKNMQTTSLKFILLLLLVFRFAFGAAAQNNDNKLKKADSLFTAKLYTQSFDLYDELFSNKLYTPSMLLKMAFIQEGLGHLSTSLYYLSGYSKLTHDAQTDEKIAELATKNNLEGYNDPYSKELIMRFFQEQRILLTWALIAFNCMILGIIVFQKAKKQRPVFAGFFLLFFLGILFWQVNFSSPPLTGIIAASNTYIMEGPSSGSSVISIANEGHKLAIEGKYDVWFKVKWNGKDAFIKENSLLPLNMF